MAFITRSRSHKGAGCDPERSLFYGVFIGKIVVGREQPIIHIQRAVFPMIRIVVECTAREINAAGNHRIRVARQSNFRQIFKSQSFSEKDHLDRIRKIEAIDTIGNFGLQIRP